MGQRSVDLAAAPPVVLLHGQPGSAAVWAPLRPLLAPRRVLAVDRPGYGLNPAGAMGFAGNVAALVARLDAAGVDRAVLVGHSWGGGVAALAAARHPDRVAGLVLAASVGPGALTATDRVLARELLGELTHYLGYLLAGPWVRRGLRRRARRTLGPGERADVERRLAANRARPLWRSALVEQRALVAEHGTLDAALPRIQAPTVVLAGTADRVVPPRVAVRLARRVPGARLVLLPGAGHALPQTHPGPLAAAVRSLPWPTR